MKAERALKRAERMNLNFLKKNEKSVIREANQEIKNTSGRGGTTCTVWVDVRYIQNVKDYFDKRGYRTEIKKYQEGQSSDELWIRWERQEAK